MKILALEFSSPERSVAVLQTDNAGQVHLRAQITSTGPSAPMKPLGSVEEILQSVGVEREQIDSLVVGLGPGSYTGIRAAIALAQGWQLGRGVKLLGVSSAASVAAWAQRRGLRGRVSVVIDAQRGEFYLAGYELGDTGVQETSPLRIALADQVRERTDTLLIGPEVTKWFPGGRIFFPQASELGRLAAGRTDFQPGEKMEPIYLRETSFVKAPPPRILPAL